MSKQSVYWGEIILVKIYALRIDEPISNNEFSNYLLCVSKEKRERINRFMFIEDAKRSLYGEILIRSNICKELKLENNQICFHQNEFGKPFLAKYSNFHFNISHAGKWVVCAISENPVGIDIEKIKTINFDIAKSFFTVSEYNDLMEKHGDDRLSYFFDLWTLKESYIKAVGKGLSLPLNSFSFKVTGSNIDFFSQDVYSRDFLFKMFYIDEGYKLAVSSKTDSFPQYIRYVSIKEQCQLSQCETI